jgi:hypothetical protein
VLQGLPVGSRGLRTGDKTEARENRGKFHDYPV